MPSRKPLSWMKYRNIRRLIITEAYQRWNSASGMCCDELQEGVMLGLEAVVELLGDLFAVESVPEFPDDARQRQSLLGGEGEGDVVQLLQESVAARAGIVRLLAEGGRSPRLPRQPLPDLCRLLRIGEDQQVLLGQFGQFRVDLAAKAVFRYLPRGVGLADKNLHAPLLGDALQLVQVPADLNRAGTGRTYPTQAD